MSDDYEHYWIGFGGTYAGDLFGKFKLPVNQHQLFFVENPDFAETLFFNAAKKQRKYT